MYIFIVYIIFTHDSSQFALFTVI